MSIKRFKKLYIKNIKYYSSNDKNFKKGYIYVEDGIIQKIAKTDFLKDDKDVLTIESQDSMYLLPAFFDMHVHFRDFKESNKETIETGALAAFYGGFTGVAIMPNTNPPIDNPSIIKDILKKAEKTPIDIYPIASITQERKGEFLSEMLTLKEAGAIAFSDDGDSILNTEIMINALKYASMFDGLIISHCEDPFLKGGHINEGKVSSKWGIKGIPPISESIYVYRDAVIAEYLNYKIHIAHVSTKYSVEVIEMMKKKGVKITSETTPHYISLTEDALLEKLDGNLKMNPPLRTEEDRKAIIEGIKNGVIDVIATDHAPHTPSQKDNEFELAKFGVIGLETAFNVVCDILYHKEKLPLTKIVELLSINPRKILGLKEIKIKEGETVNFTIVDIEKSIKIDKNKFHSRSKNSPFIGMEFKGDVLYTFYKNKYVRKD